MKVLYDIINEADPEALWESLHVETTYLTDEGIDAFLTIYQTILDSEPNRGPRVLERIEKVSDNPATLVVMNRDLSLYPERITLNSINLEDILGLYIPSMLYRICQTTVINELFRCLIRNELEKPKYNYFRLERKLKENLKFHYEDLKEKCELNQRNVDQEMKIYQTAGLRDSIRTECYEEIPDMGRRMYFDTLIHETRISEQLCRALLPSNPPTLLRLSEVIELIKTEIKRVCESSSIEAQVENFMRRTEGSEDKQPDEAYYHDRIKRHAQGTIVVEENYIPGVNIPIIYTVDQDGCIAEIGPQDLQDPLQYSIVVKNRKMKKNHTFLAGYILLYLAYPHRMHRVMKSYQLQEITYLMSKKQDIACRDSLT